MGVANSIVYIPFLAFATLQAQITQQKERCPKWKTCSQAFWQLDLGELLIEF